jgi:hypothetical protein
VIFNARLCNLVAYRHTLGIYSIVHERTLVEHTQMLRLIFDIVDIFAIGVDPC